jgi:hypothetical protein
MFGSSWPILQHLTCPMLWTARQNLGRWVRGTTHAFPCATKQNGHKILSQFLPSKGKDSVNITSKFTRKRIHFQQAESRLSLEWEQWGKVLRLKYILRNSWVGVLLFPGVVSWIWVIFFLGETLSNLLAPSLIQNLFEIPKLCSIS